MKQDVAAVEPMDQWMDYASDKPGLYLYPITPYLYNPGANDYILKLKDILSEQFTVVNTVTKLGMLDILRKLPKCNIVYFNWIIDLPDKRLGYLQIPMLILVLVLSKLFRIRIAWFIHNDRSHFSKNALAKKFIRNLMIWFSDETFSHSRELSFAHKLKELKVFEHPVEELKYLEAPDTYPIDLLIWGSVSPYKGVAEFVRFNHSSDKLDGQTIRVAGKFSSQAYFAEVTAYAKDNITFANRVHSDEELAELFHNSRFIIFCYTSASVLSSAALCKSLAYGKTVIGPNIGSFRELGRKGLLYTYESFDEMADIIVQLSAQNQQVDKQLLRDYAHATSWEGFGAFLEEHLASPAAPRPAVLAASGLE